MTSFQFQDSYVRQFFRAVCALLLLPSVDLLAGDVQLGEQIYRNQCVRCHGELGIGVPDVYDETLYGNRTLAELTKIIHDTMPDEKAHQCVDEQAKQVASYIYETFYTDVARQKHEPPRIELSRLTAAQYANVITDIFGDLQGRYQVTDERGLKGVYYNSRGYSGNKRVMDRIDKKVDFNFGALSPLKDKIGDKEFSIQWTGSLIADETGEYELKVITENGYRLWVNDRKDPILDGWVSSGMKTEQTATIHLLGGRPYPIRLDYFKFKDKSASIKLDWNPPNKTWETIPTRHLSPKVGPSSFVVSTPFPADDASAGYPRGTSVSAGWDAATTKAALETTQHVVDHLWDLARTKKDAEDREAKLREWCSRFVELALRRPLTDEMKNAYIDRQFQQATTPVDAVKRIVLVTLKSPQFLYVGLDDPQQTADDSFVIAERLALAMWDSTPDRGLWDAARKGYLKTDNHVRAQANRMLRDPRSQEKLRALFHRWLAFDHAGSIPKDNAVFPDFDDKTIADLRTSLDLFVDQVVWSEASDFRELLSADYLLMNQRLRKFYELENADDRQKDAKHDVVSDDFLPVSLENEPRSGVVTHPYLLAALSYPSSTSPIHRGVFASRHLLGRALKPPPIAVEFKDSEFAPDMTMRQKVAELTKAESCQTCHSIINPLGFTFEQFDAVGRYRTTVNDKSVDSTSDYHLPSGDAVKLSGARDLAKFASADVAAQEHFVAILFEHLAKQSPAAYGPTTVKTLRNDFEKADFSIKALIVKIMERIARSPDTNRLITKTK